MVKQGDFEGWVRADGLPPGFAQVRWWVRGLCIAWRIVWPSARLYAGVVTVFSGVV